jgi:broad specificity phosphatase PhoE
LNAATRIVLIRHAAPVDEANTVVYGRLDFELSAEGHLQAGAIAELLGGIPFAAVYSSPRLRALATAAPLATGLGLDLRVVDDLRELDFGEIEGLDREDAVRLHPELAAWTTTPGLAFPGGESVALVRIRAVAAARTLVDRHPGETIAVVSHAIPIRAIVADALDIPTAGLFRLDSTFGGFSVIDWFGDRPLVRRVNASSIAG